MAVETTGTSANFTGTGVSSTYAPGFYVNDSAQVVVMVNGVVKTIGVDYVVNNVGAAAGCNVVANFTLGAAVFIERVTPITQLVDTQNNETILEDVLDAEFDKLTMIAQELDGATDRALLVPKGESGYVLPSKANRANKYPVFDLNGDLATSPGTGTDNTLRGDLGSAGATKGGALIRHDDAVVYPANSLGLYIANLRAKRRSILDFLSVAQRADVLNGTLALDLTTVINNAIVQMTGGELVFNPGQYRIDGQLNVLAALTMNFSNRQASLVLGTQNQNGIVIGDNTDPTRNLLFGTKIIEPTITVKNGIPTFTSGAAIKRNYVAHVDIMRPQIYGKDATTTRLWDGLSDYRVSESDAPDILFQYLNGSGVYALGDGTTPGRTVDCNYDNARIFGIKKGIFIDAGCAGLGMYRPAIYGIAAAGWGIHVRCTAGPNGQNFFIDTPDIEVTPGAAGGIWGESGNRIMVHGGWIGGSNVPGVKFDYSADSCSTSADMVGCYAELNGPQNRVTGGDIAGDNTTAGANGIIIRGSGCSVSDEVSVRQWLGNGIDWGGTTPSNVKIGSVDFTSNGRDIASMDAFSNVNAPTVANGNTNKTRSYVAAATMDLPANMGFVQITGATAIATIKRQGAGKVLTIQAGAGGITINNTGNIILPSSPLAVPAFNTVTLYCDGVNWFKSV